MSEKSILSIGQCRPDQAAISNLLSTHFRATVLTADSASQAVTLLRENAVDLTLINRKLDADGSDGMEILHTIQVDETLRKVPVMLVSNFADWQEKAVAAGAHYGFGKAALNAPETIDRIADVLNS